MCVASRGRFSIFAIGEPRFRLSAGFISSSLRPHAPRRRFVFTWSAASLLHNFIRVMGGLCAGFIFAVRPILYIHGACCASRTHAPFVYIYICMYVLGYAAQIGSISLSPAPAPSRRRIACQPRPSFVRSFFNFLRPLAFACVCAQIMGHKTHRDTHAPYADVCRIQSYW